jgi:uncharacterized alkaline shock family protein YloU
MSLVIDAEHGSITVPGGTLLSIAVAAAQRVEGVRVLRRRSFDLEGPTVRLSVSVRRGATLLERARAAQDEVAGALETMCGLRPRVEIRITELA